MTDPDREKLKSLAELLSFISGKSRIYVFYTLYDTETGISFASSGAGTENSYTSRILREIYDAGYASRRREDRFLFYSLSDERVRSLLRLGVRTVLGRGRGEAVKREEAERIGAFFRVGATGRRLITLCKLCREESVEASSLAAACGVTTDAFGSQLAKLKQTGAVSAVRKRSSSFYSLKDDRWRSFLESALKIMSVADDDPADFASGASKQAHHIQSRALPESTKTSVADPIEMLSGISAAACDYSSLFLRTLSGESAFAVVSFLYDTGSWKNMTVLSEASGLSYMKVNLSIRNLKDYPVFDRRNGIGLTEVMKAYLDFLFGIAKGETARTFLKSIATPYAVRTILYLKAHRFAKRKDLMRDLGFTEDIAKNTIENLRGIHVLSRSRKGTIQPFRLINENALELIGRTIELTGQDYAGAAPG